MTNFSKDVLSCPVCNLEVPREIKTEILVLSQFFYPDPLSTGKVITELLTGLDERLFNVNVVSGRRLYQDPHAKCLASFEQKGNIRIYRVLKMVAPKEKTWGRLFNYLMFFVLSCYKVISSRLDRNIDMFFCVSNPPIMPLLGAWLKSDKNKFVYLIHDLYPDIAIKLGVVDEKSLMSRVMLGVNRYVFKKTDVIIVLGRDMKEHLVKNYHVSSEKIEVLPNWSKRLNVQRETYSRGDKFRLLYTGNMGKFHDLEMTIYAAERLSDTLELIFVGEGAKKTVLQTIVKERNINNVKFLGYLDQNEYEQILGEADALLLSLEKGLAGLAVPSKFYTYLAAWKPVIAIVDEESEVAIAIREEKCGIVMKYDDVDFFVGKINEMIEDPKYCIEMGSNALRAFEEKYEQSIVIKKYEDLFCKLCSGVR